MDIVETAKQIRRELHEIPEPSGHEVRTKKKILSFLKTNTHLFVEEYQGGILAFYDAVKATDTIAFRADFDAVSLPDGTAAHLCGHDGHTAALLGTVLSVEELKPERNVLFVFQPAEETGEGAKGMAGALSKYGVSEIYGCHNLPEFPFGQIVTSRDTFACASCGMTFFIKGEPAHAAYPELGKSPMGAMCALFDAIRESQTSNRFEPGTMATLIGVNAGQKAFGTSAEKAEVWITVRSRTEKDFRRIREYLEFTVKKACEADRISYHLEIQDDFPATVNDPYCAEKILKRCDGSWLLKEPMRWSEDFGYFLNERNVKGAFFGIGAGDCPGLHTKDYQYPEELLPLTINAFLNLI